MSALPYVSVSETEDNGRIPHNKETNTANNKPEPAAEYVTGSGFVIYFKKTIHSLTENTAIFAATACHGAKYALNFIFHLILYDTIRYTI